MSASKLKIILAMFIWGSIGIFVKFIPLPSSAIALARGIIGSLFLLCLFAFQRRMPDKQAIRKNLVLLICSGALIGFNWLLLFQSYHYTTVATATVCYYLQPVFVTLLSPLVLKEKLTLPKVCCVLAALFGMILVSGVLSEGSNWDAMGILLGVSAAIVYASVILMNKFTKNISAYDITFVQLMIAAIVMVPYVFITEDVSSFSLDGIQWVFLLVVGIFHTGIAYWLYFGSMADIPSQTIALYSYIDPVVAIIFSTFLLKEPLSAQGAIGAVCILGSTCFSEYLSKKRRITEKTNSL